MMRRGGTTASLPRHATRPIIGDVEAVEAQAEPRLLPPPGHRRRRQGRFSTAVRRGPTAPGDPRATHPMTTLLPP
eukprot:3793045-Pyramimonas_sp.AAC.2